MVIYNQAYTLSKVMVALLPSHINELSLVTYYVMMRNKRIADDDAIRIQMYYNTENGLPYLDFFLTNHKPGAY